MDFHTEDVLEFKKIRGVIADGCICALGRERAIQRPIATDADTIDREYKFVAELYHLFDINQDPPTQGLRDLRPLLKRALPRNAILEPTELVEVADFCHAVGRLKKFFAQLGDEAPALAEQADSLCLLHDVEFHIRNSISADHEVADDASELLKELRGRIRALESKVQRTLERMVRTLDDADILQDDFITQRQGRYVLPVKAGHKGKIRGIVHDASHSGETFFIEPFAVVEMTNELTELRVQAREEVRKILIGLCNMIRGEMSAFELDVALIVELDERLARARFGWERGWKVPRWSDKRPLKIVGAHHPLLLLNAPDSSVPLDLPLEGGDHALIVSGPNAGGKTTALKTVGLLTLMFQSSMPVPVDPASNFRIFERIEADIGDEQDVMAGVSTFSSHVRRIARLLNDADDRTLVLLDELGTATDPTEGGALAVAVVESLIEKGTLTLVTSHLALLKAWAEQHDRVRNASFFLDPKTHRPSYRLRLDVPGVSEALVIAEQQGLERSVIEKAYALLPEGAYDLNKVLARLEERERALERTQEEAERIRREAEGFREQLNREREELQEQRRNLKRDLLEEKEDWLRDVRQRIEAQIAQLPSREEILDAKREVQALQEEAASEQRSLDRDVPFAPTAFDRLEPGRRVRVEKFHDEGEVLDVDRERQRVTVAIRKIQVELTPDELQLIEEEPGAETSARHFKAPPRETVQSTLELHGQRAEAALENLDKYIERALRHDYAQVRIVHGRGTGALRRAVHEFLRDHPSVRSFALAPQERGGEGVTIVDLK